MKQFDMEEKESTKFNVSITDPAMKSNTPSKNPKSMVTKHVWKHNMPLVESMFKTFVLFMVAGLLLSSGIHYLQKLLLITTGVGKELEKFHADNDYLWRPVRHHSDIKIYETYERKKGVDAHHPIYHFEYKTNIPLEAFLDVLDHPNQSMEWFAWLKDHKYMGVHKSELESLDVLSNTLYSQMILRPILHLQDREFVNEVTSKIVTEELKGDAVGGGERTTVTFTYTDIPPGTEIENKFTKHNHKDCVRGALDMVLQLYTDDEGATTHLSMDLDMNMYPSRSKMDYSFPKMLMNQMIMRWGEVSLHKLVKRCKENTGMDKVIDKRAFLWNLIPIKR